MKIGSHVGMNSPSFLLGSVKEALSYNENTFMFYTGAPQNSFRVPLSQLFIKEANELLQANNIDIKDVVVHAPYLINLGNLDNEKSSHSYELLVNEIDRTVKIGCRYIVLHPGAAVGNDRFECLDQIAYYLNKAISTNPSICILLETMAGKGSELGICFEEIAYIIDKITSKDNIGVCLDTCHVNDAGYDLSNPDKLLDNFDSIIGLKYLKVVHVNDSKNERESHKDRHANIGFGTIGFDNIINFINNERINDRIFILETPYVKENEKDKISYPPYKEEIESIRNKIFDPDLLNKIIANNK